MVSRHTPNVSESVPLESSLAFHVRFPSEPSTYRGKQGKLGWIQTLWVWKWEGPKKGLEGVTQTPPRPRNADVTQAPPLIVSLGEPEQAPAAGSEAPDLSAAGARAGAAEVRRRERGQAGGPRARLGCVWGCSAGVSRGRWGVRAACGSGAGKGRSPVGQPGRVWPELEREREGERETDSGGFFFPLPRRGRDVSEETEETPGEGERGRGGPGRRRGPRWARRGGGRGGRK